MMLLGVLAPVRRRSDSSCCTSTNLVALAPLVAYSTSKLVGVILDPPGGGSLILDDDVPNADEVDDDDDWAGGC